MKKFGDSASGIVYAVLAVVGIFLLIQESITEATDEEILSHYADSGNRTGEIVGFILVTVGVMFFLWFLSVLRSRLGSIEHEPGTLSTLAFGAGVTAAGLLVGTAALLVGTSFATELSSDFVVDPNLARFAVSTGFVLLFGSVLVSFALVIATSVLALRTKVLPNWLGWVGFAAVVLAIVESILLPVFVIPAWVVVVSIVLMKGTPTSRPQAREPVVQERGPVAQEREPVAR